MTRWSVLWRFARARTAACIKCRSFSANKRSTVFFLALLQSINKGFLTLLGCLIIKLRTRFIVICKLRGVLGVCGTIGRGRGSCSVVGGGVDGRTIAGWRRNLVNITLGLYGIRLVFAYPNKIDEDLNIAVRIWYRAWRNLIVLKFVQPVRTAILIACLW